MSLQNKKVLLIIGGGISAYKALDLTRLLVKNNIEVKTILTKSGKEFVTPLSITSLSNNKVFEDIFDVNGEKEISSTYYRFIISGEQAVGFIINSLNGKILLDHTYLKFEQFVGAYNVKYPNNTIECLPKASAQDLIN